MSQCVRLCVRERLRGNKREKASASVRCFGEAPLISVKAFIVRGRSSYEERYRRLEERQEKEKLVRAGRCWWDNYTAVTVPVSHKSCAINECVCTYVWVCIFAWKDVHLCVGLCTFLIAIECCLLFLCMYTCYMCVCWYTLCRVMAALSLLKCMTMSFGVEMKFWASAVFCHFLHLYSPLFLCLCVYIYIYIFIKTTLLLLAIPSHRQRCRRAILWQPIILPRWLQPHMRPLSAGHDHCCLFRGIGRPGWFDTCLWHEVPGRRRSGTSPGANLPVRWSRGGERGGKRNGTAKKLSAALGNMCCVSEWVGTSSQVGGQLFHLALPEMWRRAAQREIGEGVGGGDGLCSCY